jgi:aminomethyltransferase
MPLQRTPLFSRHVALGARLVPFAGWEMPLQYGGGILQEHRTVRAAVGLFDVSHMGELRLRGPRALAAVDALCANDPRRLGAGRALYTPLCFADGGTVDDCLLYCLAPGREYLFVVNAANTASDQAWMRETLGARGFGPADVILADESAETGLLALQGPRAAALLARLIAPAEAAAAVDALPPFHFARDVTVAGAICLVSRTGYTGEDGFELACPADAVGALWDALLTAGQREGIAPCGLGARDTLRLEAALPLYGHELGPAVSPLEAGLGRFVRLQGRDFCGAAALRRAAAAGAGRHLVGLLPRPPAIARAGAAVAEGAGQPVGVVTSGTFSPTLGQGVALALCQAGTAAVGAEVVVDVRGRAVPAAVVSLPFYRRPAPHRPAGP